MNIIIIITSATPPKIIGRYVTKSAAGSKLKELGYKKLAIETMLDRIKYEGIEYKIECEVDNKG